MLHRATPQSAAYDLYASDDVTILPMKRAVIGTNTYTKFAQYHVGLICSRSGLAAKHGVFVLNAPGVIDSDYDGELKVILFNSGDEPYVVKKGDRIAQFLLIPRVDAHGEVSFGGPQRKGGFGSTGK